SELIVRWFGSKKGVEPDDSTIAKVNAFKAALDALPPGRDKWQEYQRLVGDVLEFLCCPPLESPRYEFSDDEERNRRDLIFENPLGSGFWAQVRHDYTALYIVADAKNYADPVGRTKCSALRTI